MVELLPSIGEEFCQRQAFRGSWKACDCQLRIQYVDFQFSSATFSRPVSDATSFSTAMHPRALARVPLPLTGPPAWLVQFEPDPRFEEAKAFIRAGTFGEYDYEPLLDSLEGNEGFGRGDYFLVGVDFASYLEVRHAGHADGRSRLRLVRRLTCSQRSSGECFWRLCQMVVAKQFS